MICIRFSGYFLSPFLLRLNIPNRSLLEIQVYFSLDSIDIIKYADWTSSGLLTHHFPESSLFLIIKFFYVMRLLIILSKCYELSACFFPVIFSQNWAVQRIFIFLATLNRWQLIIPNSL